MWEGPQKSQQSAGQRNNNLLIYEMPHFRFNPTAHCTDENKNKVDDGMQMVLCIVQTGKCDDALMQR